MEPEEAVLQFRKWLTEETTVVCSGAFSGASFNLTGKVIAASLEQVEFSASDPYCNLVLFPQCPDLRFALPTHVTCRERLRKPCGPRQGLEYPCQRDLREMERK